METPNKLEMSFVNNEDNSLSFNLPEISYAICEENGKKVCYVYSILNREMIKGTESEKLIKYKKKISRLLYKINKGISDIESDEFKNNQDPNYYVENITDISVSSVLSLFIFLSLIKDKVDIVRGVTYQPIRYISRENAANNLEDIERQQKLLERNDKIQSNQTDKFIRTFRRVNEYISDMSIDSYPYEYDEFINCSFNKENKETLDNEVIDSIGVRR